MELELMQLAQRSSILHAHRVDDILHVYEFSNELESEVHEPEHGEPLNVCEFDGFTSGGNVRHASHRYTQIEGHIE